MKLAWHIVSKDFRRFWLGALLLAVLVGLKLFLVDAVFHNEINADWIRRVRTYQLILLIAQLVFSFFLAVAAIQEDPVPDPGAFWQTLPITRRQLLGAKLTSVILLCVLPPLLVLAGGWLFLAPSVGSMGWPLLVLAEAQLGLALLAFAFGSLSRNPAQLLFWMLGTALCFLVPKLIIDPLRSLEPFTLPAAQFTHLFLLLCVGAITAAAITLNQYLSHAKKRSIVFLGIGFGLGFYVVQTLRTRHEFDFTAGLLPAQHALEDEMDHLPVSIVQADVAKPQGDSDSEVLFRVSLGTGTRPLTVNPFGWVGRWDNRQSGSTEISKFSFGGNLYRIRENWTKRHIGSLLHFPSFSAAPVINFGVESTLTGSDEAVFTRRSTPYESQIGLNVSAVSLEGRVELVPGATLRTRNAAITIDDANTDGSVIRVEFKGAGVAIRPDPGWPVGVNDLGHPPAGFALALVDFKNHDILTTSRGTTGMSAYAYGLDFNRSKLQFVIPATGSKDLRDWTLVAISSGESHYLIKSFKQSVLLKEVPAIERDPKWFE